MQVVRWNTGRGGFPEALVGARADLDNVEMAPWLRKALTVLLYIVAGILLTWAIWIGPRSGPAAEALPPPISAD